MVLYGLRELASKQAMVDDSGRPRRHTEEDLGRIFCEWLISQDDLSRIDTRLRVCELISPQFKELGFRSAMRMFFFFF